MHTMLCAYFLRFAMNHAAMRHARVYLCSRMGRSHARRVGARRCVFIYGVLFISMPSPIFVRAVFLVSILVTCRTACRVRANDDQLQGSVTNQVKRHHRSELNYFKL